VWQAEVAKAVCGQCAVRANCLSYALEIMPDGIWGGTTGEERQDSTQILRPPGPRALPRHGGDRGTVTVTGYALGQRVTSGRTAQ